MAQDTSRPLVLARAPASCYAQRMSVSEAYLRLYDIVVTLRGPHGCPWDRKQTAESLRGALIEEAYETIEAINNGDTSHAREELGDVYLIVTMLGRIFEEAGAFTVEETLEHISEKLVRRHPHVFSDATVSDADDVVAQWDRIKVEQEGKRAKDRYLDSVSSALPPLERAAKLQKRASKVGFDWPAFQGVIAKLQEEISEVTALVDPSGSQASTPVDAPPESVEEEIGDLLFSAVNAARYLDVDPSLALHRANQKFYDRFARIEEVLQQQGRSLEDASLEEMDAIWNTMRPSGG